LTILGNFKMSLYFKLECVCNTHLKKLSGYSKKNKLYQVFKELGRVERTCFLLQYISDINNDRAEERKYKIKNLM